MVRLQYALLLIAFLSGSVVASAQPVRGAPWITPELYAQLTERVAASSQVRVTPLVDDLVIVRRGAIRADSLVGSVRELHFTGRTVERQLAFSLESVARIEDERREWRRGTVIGLVIGVVGSAVVVEMVRQADGVSQLEARSAGEVNAIRFGVILGGAAAGAGIGYLTKTWRILYERP